MDSLIIIIISYCCMFMYLPIIASGIFYVRHKEVSMYSYRLDGIKSLHLTGTSAIVFGMFQTIQGIIVISGASMAIATSDVNIVFIAFVAGWITGRIGSELAQRIQGEQEYLDNMPSSSDFVVEGHLVDDEPDNNTSDADSPDIIDSFTPPPDSNEGD